MGDKYKEDPPTISLFGGNGLIGSEIAKALLLRGNEIKFFSRNKEKTEVMFPEKKVVEFTPENQEWEKEIDGSSAVINFTGEPIFKKWTSEYKKKIIESRVRTVDQIVEAISKCEIRPKVFINGTAAGYYGYDKITDIEMDEDSPKGNDFFGDLVYQWEKAANRAEEYGVRVVNVRTSLVLSASGGGLPELVSIFKTGLGGPIRPGNQWLAWIHMSDEVGLVLFSLDNEKITGALNAVSPRSTTMAEFAKTLGRVLNRPAKIKIPATLVMLRMGEVSDLIIHGKKVIPKKALQYGYVFKFPDLESALRSTLSIP